MPFRGKGRAGQSVTACRRPTAKNITEVVDDRQARIGPIPANNPTSMPNILPSEDALRTSLLISGLSARFSILRENLALRTELQPDSAAKDNVAHSTLPKSRYSGLESKLDEVRRLNTHHGNQTTTGSSPRRFPVEASSKIMERKHPSSGNNLFGGRQRIYNISLGKHSMRQLYYDDVLPFSAIQMTAANDSETRRDKATLACKNSPKVTENLETLPAPTDVTQSISSSAPNSSFSRGTCDTLIGSSKVYNALNQAISDTIAHKPFTLDTHYSDEKSASMKEVFTGANRGGLKDASRTPRQICTTSPIHSGGETPQCLVQPGLRDNLDFLGPKSELYDEAEFGRRQRQLQRQRELAPCPR